MSEAFYILSIEERGISWSIRGSVIIKVTGITQQGVNSLEDDLSSSRNSNIEGDLVWKI